MSNNLKSKVFFIREIILLFVILLIFLLYSHFSPQIKGLVPKHMNLKGEVDAWWTFSEMMNTFFWITLFIHLSSFIFNYSIYKADPKRKLNNIFFIGKISVLLSFVLIPGLTLIDKLVVKISYTLEIVILLLPPHLFIIYLIIRMITHKTNAKSR